MRRFAGLCLAAFGCASASPAPEHSPSSPSRPAAVVSAVPTGKAGTEDLFLEFERIFGEQFVARRLPGLAMGFVLDGKLVWSKGWGYADVARKVGQRNGLAAGTIQLSQTQKGDHVVLEPIVTQSVREAACARASRG